jgi:hypothetical protein
MHMSSFLSKITSVFENFEWINFWPSRPEYPPPPRAEYPVGPDYRIIRPGCDWVYIGRGRAALGQFLSRPRPRVPSRRRRRPLIAPAGAPAIPLA